MTVILAPSNAVTHERVLCVARCLSVILTAIKIDFAVELEYAQFRSLNNPQETPDGNDQSAQHPFVSGMHRFIKMAEIFYGDEVTFTTSRT